MAQGLQFNKQTDEGRKSAVTDIVRSGERLTLPDDMSLDQGIELLERRKKYESEQVDIIESFDVFPYDGACALDTVLQRRYGWAPATASPGMFGPVPPKLLSIDVGPNEKRQVPWGEFELPNVKGKIKTGLARVRGRLTFAVQATVLRQSEEVVRSLFEELRKEVMSNSIYRGKAIKIRFRDDEGDLIDMPEPRFLETADIDETMLIFPASIEAAVTTSLFTPIARAQDCLDNGISLKRGVLLGGTYGTGKTLAAAVASKLAVLNHITYIYVPRADELPEAIEFAKQYQSPAAVVFCEDIDRATEGERSVKMDDILNIIDGIDSKMNNIIVVLTTNKMSNINAAMLRPGRLDAVIEIMPPDAEAVQRLLRAYGKGDLDASEDLSDVGALLDGNIPAVIAEVVKRARLAQLALQPPGTKVKKLTGKALLAAAHTITAQVELLRANDGPKAAPALESALADVLRGALNGTKETIVQIDKKVSELHDNM